MAKEAIEELNQRFKEHGVGYQFTDGKIFRVDSAFIYTEAVIPALVVLRDPEYKNAQDEFLSAFEHYRHGRSEESLVDCCKAFESTMKIICQKRGWPFDPLRSTASALVQSCLDNGLVPRYWEQHFTGLRTMLTSGIPHQEIDKVAMELEPCQTTLRRTKLCRMSFIRQRRRSSSWSIPKRACRNFGVQVAMHP